MKATGWQNGSPNNETGAGYGLRVAPEDRDRHFKRAWTEVTLYLGPDAEVEVSVSPSFWRGCSELRSRHIGQFLLAQDLAPWPEGHPPLLELEPIGHAAFRVQVAFVR